MDAPDPLAHLPDPDKRYQVFAVIRGGVLFVEVADVETKTGFVLDVVTALEVASDINAEIARVFVQHTDQTKGWIDPEAVDPGDQRWHKEIWKRGQG
jgi:hypothetical protein